MGDQRRSLEQAWSSYEQLLSQDPVTYSEEPEGVEPLLANHCRLGGSSRNFWTDAYLAAFAEAGNTSLVTLDKGFQRFPNLPLVLLA